MSVSKFGTGVKIQTGFKYLSEEQFDECWDKAEDALADKNPDRMCVSADWRLFSLEKLPIGEGDSFGGVARDDVRVVVCRDSGQRFVFKAKTRQNPVPSDNDWYCRRRMHLQDGILGTLPDIAPVNFNLEADRERDQLKSDFEDLVDDRAEAMAAKREAELAKVAAEPEAELKEFVKALGKKMEDIRNRELQVQTEDKELISVRTASEFAGQPVPERQWVVPDLIPHRNVTGLSGDGGTGKTLLALQLGVGVAFTGYWLEMEVHKQGPVIFFSAEDELDELHRRLADICAAEKIDLESLDDFQILPMAGLDAMLATHDRSSGSMKKTNLWLELVRIIELFEPALVVIDTQADVFGGDEINRRQAREFITMLRGLAFRNDAAVLLLSHPSLTGISTGTGSSGSTGWNNSLRSRLYFKRILADDRKTELDPDLRLLSNEKANYAARGTEIRVRWENGVFEPDGEKSGTDKKAATQVAEQVFMDLLRLFESQGRNVSPNESKTYAPTVFAAHPDARGITKRMFALAMERLFQANRIRIEVSGPPSRKRERLVTV
jgi:RecA-family ATPase